MFFRIVIILCFIFSSYAYALNNPAPFGLEIGKATLKEVQEKIGKKTKLSFHYSHNSDKYNSNKYCNEKILTGSGSNLGIDGLIKIILVFDNQDKLVAFVMKINKDYFESIMNSLSKKYELVEKNIPFVGNKLVRFKQGDSVITLEAPHLSFEMELSYATEKFIEYINAEYINALASKKAIEKDQDQRSKL